MADEKKEQPGPGIAIMLGLKKGAKGEPGEEESSKPSSDMLGGLAQEILDAVSNKDATALQEALSGFIDSKTSE